MLDTAASAEQVSISQKSSNKAKKLLKPVRYFTKDNPNISPYDLVEWVLRDVEIKDIEGNVVFSQSNIEVPKAWSLTATTIVAQKYFRGHGEARENSVKQLIDRVVDTIANAGVKYDYFNEDSAKILADELRYLCLHQMMAFNSPVWFNVGTTDKPQSSACFILEVEDDMESILNWVTEEGLVFRKGSGAGVNLSRIREKNAKLSGGGYASGPLSFALSADRSAGAIKSGGTSRRAAKMLCMDVDHPDIEDFIQAKIEGEKVARGLIAAGFDPAFNAEGGAYEMAPWQNANNSVRVTDEFMEAVKADKEFDLISRTNGDVVRTVRAKDLFRKIANAAWECGDPGLQFHDTINEMNTCKEDGVIEASNPCCLIGETLVDTSEGRIAIAELANLSERGEKLPYAFGHDIETGLPVLRQINKGWKAGDASNLVKVITDKGVEIVCTPEHEFLTFSGDYVEAKDLKPGTRLRKIARWANEKRGNRFCLNLKATPTNTGGTVWQNRFMWEQVNGPIPNGMHVHHVNGNRRDDRLSNFALVDGKDHVKEHSLRANNARFIPISPLSLVEVWETVEERVRNKKNPNVTPSRWNTYIKKSDLTGIVPLAGSVTYGGRIQGMPWAEFGAFIEEHRDGVNDRVAAVEAVAVDGTVPVYDIEVEGVHNFAVSMGDTAHSIVVSNSEFVWLNNNACNLASLNLMKFGAGPEKFDINAFVAAAEHTILAQEILVALSGYPTEKITAGAKKYRTLGMGFSNLGALIMSKGMAYDSNEGRSLAGAITSLLSATGYCVSGEVATVKGAFDGFEKNRGHVLDILQKHLDANLDPVRASSKDTEAIYRTAMKEWSEAIEYTKTTGVRNAQISVLAPCGTISFMMDCDTTGVEPDLALVKYKKLVGGGSLKLANRNVSPALATLGYPVDARNMILDYIEANDTIEGAPVIQDEHLSVFDCSLAPAKGVRSIASSGHLGMMAAVQPFLSGATSKTVNLSSTATVDDIEDIYLKAWESGIKAVALYRDGCKESQPMNLKAEEKAGTSNAPQEVRPLREKLPDDRMAAVHKFSIQGHDGYLTLGYYPDGRLGEVFINMAKQGSTLGGLMDAWATMISMGLQYGIPLTTLVDKFKHTSFEPSGFTSNADIRMTSSLLDYVVRLLEMRGLVATDGGLMTVPVKEDESLAVTNSKAESVVSGPPCTACGHMTIRSGACYICDNCGSTSGCG